MAENGLELARLLAAENQVEPAVRVLEEVLYADTLNPEVHRLLGGLYLQLGRGPEAADEYRVLLELSPLDTADAHYHLARALDLAGDTAQAPPPGAAVPGDRPRVPGRPEVPAGAGAEMKRHLSWVLLLAAPLLLSTSPEVSADPEPNDSTLFQFVRIRYHGFVSSWGGGRGRWVPPWMHDYPRAEQNFLKIFMELTGIETTPESYLVLDLNDPRIMNYPALYVSEPGYWNITGEEAANLREYLLRGGFVIFDDFRGAGDWHNFTSCMQQVYPERGFEELDDRPSGVSLSTTSTAWTCCRLQRPG